MEQEFKHYEGIEVEGFVVDVELEYHVFTSQETRTEPSSTQKYYAGMDIQGVWWDGGEEVSEDFFKDRVNDWETKILQQT